MIHRFSNKRPTNFFAAVYKYYIYEEILDIDVNELKQYLKVKDNIINNSSSDGDGDTGLGDDSFTSRHNSFNLFRMK